MKKIFKFLRRKRLEHNIKKLSTLLYDTSQHLSVEECNNIHEIIADMVVECVNLMN